MDETQRCPRCRRLTSPAAKFCPRCGLTLNHTRGVPAQATVAIANVSPAARRPALSSGATSTAVGATAAAINDRVIPYRAAVNPQQKRSPPRKAGPKPSGVLIVVGLLAMGAVRWMMVAPSVNPPRTTMPQMPAVPSFHYPASPGWPVRDPVIPPGLISPVPNTDTNTRAYPSAPAPPERYVWPSAPQMPRDFYLHATPDPPPSDPHERERHR